MNYSSSQLPQSSVLSLYPYQPRLHLYPTEIDHVP
ncbi:hypothetical protein HYP93_gp02 [Stenotrophomonas phage Pokken]|uniref:Uncharacterized protein n=1 Tax=Stenotrophomonas phage Pokken TaxID=2596674 RepID=A0A5B9N8P2_9CAUD|nr:hypothetical protein HYP93_gp02 [Stenotrophomonas phage Pokken]QEG09225.1 hypothetical protein CPT_Pokken_002 [Stenotrophomonas phage Pokken]